MYGDVITYCRQQQDRGNRGGYGGAGRGGGRINLVAGEVALGGGTVSRQTIRKHVYEAGSGEARQAARERDEINEGIPKERVKREFEDPYSNIDGTDDNRGGKMSMDLDEAIIDTMAPVTLPYVKADDAEFNSTEVKDMLDIVGCK